MRLPHRLVIIALMLGVSLPLLRAAERAYTIAVIPMGTTHEYWKMIHAGALKAQAELKAQGTEVELIWKGPLREDDRDQIGRAHV